MDLKGKTAALYGRFSAGAREALGAEIARRGGAVARDLTRRTDLFVVGSLALPLIATGRLNARIAAARARGTPVLAEERFAELLGDGADDDAVLPLDSIRAANLPRDAVEILAAFDLVRMDGGKVRFADAATLKTAAELLHGGRLLSETVRILTEARAAPAGRRRVVLDERGDAALKWEDGLTRLDGQGLLPLVDDGASIDDLFEAAAIAEGEEDFARAARLYEAASRADKKDAVAPFNLGVMRLAADAPGEAALAFRQAIARDPKMTEARYNLAAASERLGKDDLARQQLIDALRVEPGYDDARFNLAQLELKRGALGEARMHFERYLAGGPPSEWADIARRAIQYCAAAEAAGHTR